MKILLMFANFLKPLVKHIISLFVSCFRFSVTDVLLIYSHNAEHGYLDTDLTVMYQENIFARFCLNLISKGKQNTNG